MGQQKNALQFYPPSYDKTLPLFARYCEAGLGYSPAPFLNSPIPYLSLFSRLEKFWWQNVFFPVYIEMEPLIQLFLTILLLFLLIYFFEPLLWHGLSDGQTFPRHNRGSKK